MKKKKKLTKVQLLKNKIKELEQQVYDAERNATYYETKYDEVKNQLNNAEDKYKGYLNRIEGIESPVLSENKWLRDTLRLVIVPKGKEQELAKLVDEEMKKQRY